MDKEFLTHWFQGFEKGLDKLDAVERDRMLAECGRACVCRTALVYREEAARAAGLQDFLERVSGRVPELLYEMADGYGAVLACRSCVCGLVREQLVHTAHICACSRQCLESALEKALGAGNAEVTLLCSILDGAETCRFAIRLSREARWGGSAPLRERGPLAAAAPPAERTAARAKPRPRGKKAPVLIRAQRELALRDKTWRITAPIQILVLVGVLAVGGALSILAPKPEESPLERRELAPKPDFTLSALADGSYIQALDLYYADTFPFRDRLIGAAGKLEGLYGVRVDGARIHNAGDPGPGPAPSGPEPPAAPEPSDGPGEDADAPAAPRQIQPPAAPDEGTQGEKVGPVFVYNGEAMSIFGTGSNAQADYYARALNDWKQTLGPGVTQYSLIAPTHIEFALPEKYSDISAPQKPNIDYINARLDPAIRAVDAYSKIALHQEEYLYFRTDHHWTGLGAYYAYTAFCEEAGLTPTPLASMEKRAIPDFIGSMYAQANQDAELLKRPDTVEYWIPATPHEVALTRRGSPFASSPGKLFAETAQSPNTYSVFLGGDFPVVKITSENRNGRKIAVVKESFGNAFAPFLVNHYEEVYVVDQRYFEQNLPAFMRQNGINEILFLNNIFAANTAVRIDEVARLRIQVYQPPAPDQEETDSKPDAPDAPEPPDTKDTGSSPEEGKTSPEKKGPSPGKASEEEEGAASSKPRARKRTTSSSRRFINEFEKDPDDEYDY